MITKEEIVIHFLHLIKFEKKYYENIVNKKTQCVVNH